MNLCPMATPLCTHYLAGATACFLLSSHFPSGTVAHKKANSVATRPQPTWLFAFGSLAVCLPFKQVVVPNSNIELFDSLCHLPTSPCPLQIVTDLTAVRQSTCRDFFVLVSLVQALPSGQTDPLVLWNPTERSPSYSERD